MSIRLLPRVKGADLDRHAAKVGVLRRFFESDVSLRARVNACYLYRHGSGTSDEIETWVRSVLPSGVDVRVEDLPGLVAVTLTEPLWRRWLIFPARRDRRLAEEVMPKLVVAGVQWRVKTRG